MKNKKLLIGLIILIFLIIFILVMNLLKKDKIEDNKTKILTSFYPVYIMTINLTDGAKDVEVSNLAENHTGCIHDYTLNTADLRKFETTDIFIQNGKDLESFNEKILSLYPDLSIIDSSINVTNLIEEEDEINPHIWLSIDNYISQLNTIKDKLIEFDQENKEVYLSNYNKYLEKLNLLKNEYESFNVTEKKGVICLNEALDYLLNDLGLEVTSIETDHEQSALSAENIKEIITEIKDQNIKAIFIDKNDSDKTAQILANETDAKIYVLDSGMDGNKQKDDFINTMESNLEVLKSVDF